jgi:hypothetical protein
MGIVEGLTEGKNRGPVGDGGIRAAGETITTYLVYLTPGLTAS